MCGITGYLDIIPQRPEEDLRAVVLNMENSLKHRGPDEGNIWLKPEHGIALGHRRLSIQDISPTGAQPMTSASGRHVIVYNGELYNKAELAAYLQYTPRGTSDTEILLENIATHGVAATLQRLNGIFAFAIYDLETRTLTLARDQMGVKPLYYGMLNGCFMFASELQALKNHPQFTGAVNLNAARHMLQYGAIHAPDSIYTDIFQLPAGMWGELRHGEFITHQYYSIAEIAHNGQRTPFQGDLKAATDALHDKLRIAVRSQMVSDVPLGAFLSGGIDSSTVVALMQESANIPVKTFSIGFDEASYNEAPYAEAVARHLGSNHTTMIVNARQAQDVIPLLPSIYSEPFADSSQIPTFLVSQLARQHVTVALSGDGGDECFGGYIRHDALARLWRYLSPIPVPVRERLSRMLMAVPTSVWQNISHAIPAQRRPAHFAEKLQKTMRLLGARSVDDMYSRLVRQWGDDIIAGGAPDIANAHKSELSISAHLRLQDFQTYLPDDILTKVDRASMAVGLEARVPLLDKNIVEFAWTLPAELLIHAGTGKLPLRGVLHKYVPESIFNRPKQGFSVPIEHWLRTDLRDWAEDLLSEQALQSLPYDSAGIRERWQQHLAGTHVWHNSLWHVLMLQAWLRHNS